MPTIRLAMAAAATVLVGILAGCGDQSAGSAQTPKESGSPKPALAQDKIKYPEYYGFYAIDAGKTVTIVDKGPPLSLSANVEFLLFHKAVAAVPPDPKLYMIPLAPREPEQFKDNSFKGWDDWFNKTQNEYPKAMQEALSGIPANAKRFEVRTKPVDGQPEMIRLVPSTTLEPGMYKIQGATFWVEQDVFLDRFREQAREANKRSDWIHARLLSDFVVGVKPEDSEMAALSKSAAQTYFDQEGGLVRSWTTAPYGRYGSVPSVTRVAIASDGEHVFSGSRESSYGLIQKWNRLNDAPLSSVETHAFLTGMARSMDGRRLAAGSDSGGAAQILDIEKGSVVKQFRHPRWQYGGSMPSVQYVAFSHDGRFVAASHGPETFIWSLDEAGSESSAKDIKTQFDAMGPIAFSPDGLRLLIGGRLIDLMVNKEIASVKGEHERVCFSADGSKAIISGSKTIPVLWDLEGDVPRQTPTAMSVGQAMFLPDASHAVAVSPVGTIDIWPIGGAAPIRRFAFNPEDIAVSDDGRYLVAAAGNNIRLFQLPRSVWVTDERRSQIAEKAMALGASRLELSQARTAAIAKEEDRQHRLLVETLRPSTILSGQVTTPYSPRKFELTIQSLDSESGQLVASILFAKAGGFGGEAPVREVRGTLVGTKLKLEEHRAASEKGRIAPAVIELTFDLAKKQLFGTRSQSGETGHMTVDLSKALQPEVPK